MLKIQNLNIFHTDCVKNFNLEVNPSQIVSLTGRSGCGKSSILKVILGISKNFEGSVVLNNTFLSKEGKVLINTEARQIGIVFQDYSLFNHMTVRDNIYFGMKTISKKQKEIFLDSLLKTVSLPSSIKDRHPYELSGGEQQRVAIARTLAIKPKALLLDEHKKLISETSPPG